MVSPHGEFVVPQKVRCVRMHMVRCLGCCMVGAMT